jgi:hypothetical protein
LSVPKPNETFIDGKAANEAEASTEARKKVKRD